MSLDVEQVIIAWRECRLEIEYAWINRQHADAPLIVFLHDGLGCISMWRDYPQQLCNALSMRGLVFSRYGYGYSAWRSPSEQWGADFLQVQACELIPSMLAELGVAGPVWLYGQSDGGSIALIMAAHQPLPVAGAIVTAPHIMIELVTVKGIHDARAAFAQGELKRGLARHHRDPDAVMQGWGGSWLAPGARDWNILPLLARIRCPLLAMQGKQDHYGSMEQIRAIRRLAPHARLLELEDCGHIAHQDKTAEVLHASASFIRAACPRPQWQQLPHWPWPPGPAAAADSVLDKDTRRPR